MDQLGSAEHTQPTRTSKRFLMYPHTWTAIAEQKGSECALWIPNQQLTFPIPPSIRHMFRVIVSEHLPPVRIRLWTEIQGTFLQADASFVSHHQPSAVTKDQMLPFPKGRTTKSDGYRGELVSLWVEGDPRASEDDRSWTYLLDLLVSPEVPLIRLALVVDPTIPSVRAHASFAE